MFNIETIISALGSGAVIFSAAQFVLNKINAHEANHGMSIATRLKYNIFNFFISAGVIISLFVLDSPGAALALVFIYCVLWIVVFAVKSGAPSRLEIVGLLLDGMLLMGAIIAFVAWFSGAYN